MKINTVKQKITSGGTSIGTFIFELPYWYNLVLHEQFDQIYHEHVNYFTVKSSEFLLKKCGLQIVKIKETEYHGGSIRIYSKIKRNVKNILIYLKI